MLCREIIALCSEIHTKHIHTRCGQNVEMLNVKLVVHIVTTGLEMLIVNIFRSTRMAFLKVTSFALKRLSFRKMMEPLGGSISG
jgi:hypothetical protein